MNPLTRDWVRKAEADWLHAKQTAETASSRRDTFHDQVCFHCQQSAEKYLKALLQESALVVPRTHDLVQLVDLLRPVDATLVALRRGMNSLTPYAVEYRYPGISATKRQAQAALRHAETVRAAIRQRLGLPI